MPQGLNGLNAARRRARGARLLSEGGVSLTHSLETFTVRGSKPGTAYLVTITVMGDGVRLRCTCLAGRHAAACYHREVRFSW